MRQRHRVTARSRILAAHLRMHLETVLEFTDAIHDTQCGFRQDRSTWTAGLQIKSSLHRKKDYHLLLVDVEKAFDSLDFRVLIRYLAEIGIDTKTTSTIARIYDSTRLGPKVLGFVPCFVKMERGVRQGCVRSPLLWNIWVSIAKNQKPKTKNWRIAAAQLLSYLLLQCVVFEVRMAALLAVAPPALATLLLLIPGHTQLPARLHELEC